MAKSTTHNPAGGLSPAGVASLNGRMPPIAPTAPPYPSPPPGQGPLTMHGWLADRAFADVSEADWNKVWSLIGDWTVGLRSIDESNLSSHDRTALEHGIMRLLIEDREARMARALGEK